MTCLPSVSHLNDLRGSYKIFSLQNIEMSSNIQRIRADHKCSVHLNSLRSIWWGVIGLIIQLFLVKISVTQITSLTPIPTVPEAETWFCYFLMIAGIFLIPISLLCCIFKVGNIANDGGMLGDSTAICSKAQPSVLSRPHSTLCYIFYHSGPTSSILHLLSSILFFILKVKIEARLILSGLIYRGKL